MHHAGNKIERTRKVDNTTLSASRGKFARVCVEIDLNKPLKSGYTLRNRHWKIQYEGLQVVCFHCGKYGQGEASCPSKLTIEEAVNECPPLYVSKLGSSKQPLSEHTQENGPSFGAWMIAERCCRRPDRPNYGEKWFQIPCNERRTTPTEKQLPKQNTGKVVHEVNQKGGKAQPTRSCLEVLNDLIDSDGVEPIVDEVEPCEAND